MANVNKTAGFVAVQDGYAIFGAGETKEAALNDATEWADDVTGLKVYPATEALIAAVKKDGGQVAYEVTDGVACTEAEAQ